MANLQVRDIDDRLYQSLRDRASQDKRSISQEVVLILEKYLSDPNQFSTNPTDEFLRLSGAWEDDRDADAIIQELRGNRSSGTRFAGERSVLD